MSHPDLPADIIQNTLILLQSPYKIAALKKVINEIETTGKIKKAFIYFNNDIDVSAIKNAKEMIAMVNKAREGQKD